MIDTFSGIGGFSLAARWLGGIETVQFVEREPYCQRILSKHFPGVPIHDDICTFQPQPGSADIVCGGFPCQDISQAGAGAGIREGTRSGLFYELMRVVRLVGPRFVVLENVAAITHRGLDIVLGELAEAGFDAEWACIKASDVGACHQRDRWWCVAHAQGQQRHDGGPADPARAAGAASKPRDGDGANAAHPNHQGLEGRQPAGVPERGIQWPARPGDPPGGRLSPDWRSYVSEPVLCRGDDGLSGRVDRLKALGNAVVPQVAMIPLARVLELTAAPSTPAPIPHAAAPAPVSPAAAARPAPPSPAADGSRPASG
jgi:DNA (cytosine-5)-methyltransferase 1